MNENGDVAELWSENGFHVHFKYDSQHRVIEQLTDTSKNACDVCPLPGAIHTRYEDHTREETFFDPGGKAVLQRITALEKDGSIASIRYAQPNGTYAQDAPDLYRIIGAITPQGGERQVVTTWDDHGNWTEKREVFQPRVGASITQFIYRRTITYR